MARYVQHVGDHTFEINVVPMTLSDGLFAPFFVAHISRFEETARVPIRSHLGKCEVYGPTEAWALQNARDLLAAGWECARTT